MKNRGKCEEARATRIWRQTQNAHERNHTELPMQQGSRFPASFACLLHRRLVFWTTSSCSSPRTCCWKAKYSWAPTLCFLGYLPPSSWFGLRCLWFSSSLLLWRVHEVTRRIMYRPAMSKTDVSERLMARHWIHRCTVAIHCCLAQRSSKWFGAHDAGPVEVKGLASDHTGGIRCGWHG